METKISEASSPPSAGIVMPPGQPKGSGSPVQQAALVPPALEPVLESLEAEPEVETVPATSPMKARARINQLLELAPLPASSAQPDDLQHRRKGAAGADVEAAAAEVAATETGDAEDGWEGSDVDETAALLQPDTAGKILVPPTAVPVGVTRRETLLASLGGLLAPLAGGDKVVDEKTAMDIAAAKEATAAKDAAAAKDRMQARNTEAKDNDRDWDASELLKRPKY